MCHGFECFLWLLIKMDIVHDNEMNLCDDDDVQQCMRTQNENLKLKDAIHALCFLIEE